jgi:RimJ/RimL family protein N-acetyltransferase
MKVTLVAARAGDLDDAGPELTRGLDLGFRDPGVGRASVGEVLDTLSQVDRPEAWGAFWALSRELGAYVGLCGFKTAPGLEGEVEIAYYTLPGLEGRGFATAMAAALVTRARAQGASVVTANTLPEQNASGRVLIRNAFVFMGPAQDPEDGLVWAWRLDLG